jgi:hypothetical protein
VRKQQGVVASDLEIPTRLLFEPTDTVLAQTRLHA